MMENIDGNDEKNTKFRQLSSCKHGQLVGHGLSRIYDLWHELLVSLCYDEHQVVDLREENQEMKFLSNVKRIHVPKNRLALRAFRGPCNKTVPLPLGERSAN